MTEAEIQKEIERLQIVVGLASQYEDPDTMMSIRAGTLAVLAHFALRRRDPQQE